MLSSCILLFRLQSDHSLKLLVVKLASYWCWKWTVKRRNTVSVYKVTLKTFRLIQRPPFFLTHLSMYRSKIVPQRNYQKSSRVLTVGMCVVLHFALFLPVTYCLCKCDSKQGHWIFCLIPSRC